MLTSIASNYVKYIYINKYYAINMFITYTINAPSEVFLLCCWRDDIVDKAPVDGDEDEDDVLANAGWYKNMINILDQLIKIIKWKQ